MSYWLMKSEPDAYSIDDLERDRRQPWDGVRNYQARNMIRDRMKPGDQAFFYHSSCEVPAVVGLMKIASEPYPDPTQFDRRSKYYDPKSGLEAPRWYLVDVRALYKVELFSLAQLRGVPELADMLVLRRGNRLSITPVSDEHWGILLKLLKKA